MTAPAPVLVVSHAHWDREWYRTFEAFRARLVDTVDRVLVLLAERPDWSFVLDGQAIVLEDYVAVRPHRRAEVEEAVRAGRLAIGPWYVQPDSLLPGGEAHVRNLLEGRRVTDTFGPGSRVAYTPDSFGHPAQFPQLFAGFGLGPFVYWRGNGAEIDELGGIYRWEAPDGSGVTAYHLREGYFTAADLPADADEAAEALLPTIEKFGEPERAPLLLLNGIDHMLPDPNVMPAVAALARRTGRTVTLGVLDDLIDTVDPENRVTFRGELVGGRIANLLPGVWSSRLHLKLDNRRAERALVTWAEPWTALGHVLGLDDEGPSLVAARRALLANQAHDSIGGCSQDEVHRQMRGRTATAVELADQTTARTLDRLAGLGPERRVPWSTELDVAVFNPDPVDRTDVVRLPLDGFPLFRMTPNAGGIHPFALDAAVVPGFTVDGRPARVIASTDPGRVRLLPEFPALDVEFVAEAVPAFGWKRMHLAPGEAAPDVVDDGREIAADAVTVRVEDAGTLAVTIGARSFTGLAAIEDLGDRGDTYDFDPVADDPGVTVTDCRVTRERHPSGIARLTVERTLAVPAGLTAARDARRPDTVPVTVRLVARVAPGVPRIDLHVAIDNPAHDHRLRLRFPTGAPVTTFRAATTFDTAVRSTTPPDDARWVHRAPTTFPHQGWVEANGLVVGAPGLPEAEVTPAGDVMITVLRAVGWLAQPVLGTRPDFAGPGLETPEAQCPGGITASLSLGLDPSGARAAEAGLRAVPAGPEPVLADGVRLVTVVPDALVLSALKPAEDGDGVVLRVRNPTDETRRAEIEFGFPVGAVTSVRLDESPDDGGAVERTTAGVAFAVAPHQLRTVRITRG